MKRMYRVILSVEVEPETDLKHFQPGLVCSTFVGTEWRFVDATPLDAIQSLLNNAFHGNYGRRALARAKHCAEEEQPAYVVEEVMLEDDVDWEAEEAASRAAGGGM